MIIADHKEHVIGRHRRDEKSPDAFKDALKYAYKYRKKDDNMIYWDRYENFFAALKDSANKLGQYFIAQEQFRKASSVYKYARNKFQQLMKNCVTVSHGLNPLSFWFVTE